MSETTHVHSIAKPLLIGSAMIAAGLIAAAALRRLGKAEDPADSIIQTCESALERLLERSRAVAA